MNTCCAGAVLTTRSKRGSTGAPGSLGISARNGGSSASRTASGWLARLCFAAPATSARMAGSVCLVTIGGSTHDASRTSIARLILFMVSILPSIGGVGRAALGGPHPAVHRGIQPDHFGGTRLLENDFGVVDPDKGRVSVSPPQ